MIKFLFKGILRDKNRSLLPVIVITIGVTLTITLSGFMRGMMDDIIDQNARYQTGHVKIMTRAYAKNQDQIPNDLAFMGVDTLVNSVRKQFPEMQWVERINFGGLIDVPDKTGNTRAQGPATGMALQLLSDNSGETKRLNIKNSIVKGGMLAKKGEVLIGNDFAQKLNLHIGDTITYFGSTVYGSMTFQNFIICGTIHFGSAALDRSGIIIDISDAQQMLNMENGAGEILGYFTNGGYDDAGAQLVTDKFNAQYKSSKDEFAPEMFTLKEQNNLGSMIDYINMVSKLFVIIFVIAMSIVLWNTGLLAGLRRYQEFGIRLALGESKGHIYRSILYEATLVGAIGSVIGTVIGLATVYYLQVYGLDIGRLVENGSMMMPSIMRAKLTAQLLYIGFIPGLFAMVLGNLLSGIGIYKRETATLFKELEV